MLAAEESNLWRSCDSWHCSLDNFTELKALLLPLNTLPHTALRAQCCQRKTRNLLPTYGTYAVSWKKQNKQKNPLQLEFYFFIFFILQIRI